MYCLRCNPINFLYAKAKSMLDNGFSFFDCDSIHFAYSNTILFDLPCIVIRSPKISNKL